MFDVVTIGSTTRDVFLEGDFQILETEAFDVGKAIAIPLGSKRDIDSLTVTLGGNSANAAVTFARQGFSVGCFAEVGKENAGKEVANWLKAESVAPLLRKDPAKKTAYSTVLLTKSGERSILSYHGANEDWEKAPPTRRIQARWWYVSLSGKTARFFPKLMKFAKANHISVALNPSGAHIRERREELLAGLKDVTFLVLNGEEAALMLEMSLDDSEAVFRRLDELVQGTVAVTYGPKGAVVSNGKYLLKAGIFPERSLKDRTGAGDAFGSGFVAGLLAKESEREGDRWPLEAMKYALSLASANATSVVEHVGATPGILKKEAFLSEPRWRELPIEVIEL